MVGDQPGGIDGEYESAEEDVDGESGDAELYESGEWVWARGGRVTKQEDEDRDIGVVDFANRPAEARQESVDSSQRSTRPE